ncbi:MAG: hypothetical protein OEM67_11840, partial [Thermoleophilia bacterium]|nr:hypothetical protein [Thermoleophilia bacterium]
MGKAPFSLCQDGSRGHHRVTGERGAGDPRFETDAFSVAWLLGNHGIDDAEEIGREMQIAFAAHPTGGR